MTSRPAQTPRKAALYLLNQVLVERRLVSELTAQGALERLDPADRARAQRLAMDTLRGLERADKLLAKHLKKAPPLAVRNILRLAAVELAQGGDAHGVVNEAVTLTGANKRIQTMKGMVNAVLRKVAETAVEDWAKQRAPRLPRWLRDPLVDCYGPEEVARMEQAHFAGAPLDISAKADAQAVCDALGGELMPTGSVRLAEAGQVSALPGFQPGDWWVQDAAAALPAKVLSAQPGETVLDMCAAPGGKTMQLAAAGADVTALDISAPRMARVQENLTRTGLSAHLVTGDALEHTGQYDAILLDAPCSATGTIRRHPDLPQAKDGSDFWQLFELQARMLDHALSLLKPGGRLVYATCSLLPDEGEVQIDEALARHPGLRTDPDALDLPGIDPAWRTEEGGLRLLPSYWRKQGGMDGFYIACLRKD
ncbi:methyltransferase domain-containing protein [Thalassobius vesicularis]|uniref:Methyltransferase domain-containing protein n=1 Tax=Thalassobius vesicularis TaxID=1294297 RepID=A0A4S3M9K8_9RHOB|nr:transcription antitermination factor NusB [Thalassobius vesicularis]THD73994.1 methyltransferase domain-containing protein [Thalassobius vesicularis]